MKIFNELPTAFPWYDKVEKQQHYRENAKIARPYQLISPKDALLPFEILIETGTVLQATAWYILDLKGTILMDISSNISQLKGRTVDAGTYVFFNGAQMTADFGAGIQTLSLPCGTYYSQLVFGGTLSFYSERFMVPANNFGVNDPAALINYMKISYTNGCDISPILYTGNNSDIFTQIMYLDTFVHASEPEVEEDGEQDGDQRQIDRFQRMIVSYRFSVAVPDFMKIAITSLTMHSSVNVVTPKGVRSGSISDITISSNIEDDGAYSKVDVKLEETVMVKHGCCENMTLSASNQPVNIFSIEDGTGGGAGSVHIGYQVPTTANSQIVTAVSWHIALIPVTPGVRYFINFWHSTRTELGFYGPGTSNNPTVLSVISSGAVTKISGSPTQTLFDAYTVIAPAGAAYMAFNIKSNSEATSVYNFLTIWANNPGAPYLNDVLILQTLTGNVTNVKVTAYIPFDSWGDIYYNGSGGGAANVLLVSGITPDQLKNGYVYNGVPSTGGASATHPFLVKAKNYSAGYGFSQTKTSHT